VAQIGPQVHQLNPHKLSRQSEDLDSNLLMPVLEMIVEKSLNWLDYRRCLHKLSRQSEDLDSNLLMPVLEMSVEKNLNWLDCRRCLHKLSRLSMGPDSILLMKAGMGSGNFLLA